MIRLIWKLLNFLDNNHGYSTPLQKRFKVGDIVSISSFKQEPTIQSRFADSNFKIGTQVTIIENGRHDYLVENNKGKKGIFYQFELV